MIKKKLNECPKCGKIYVLPGSLKTHLLSHVNDDKHTCLECLKVFKTEAQLKEHALSHLKTYANITSRAHDRVSLSKKTNRQVLSKSDSFRSSTDVKTGTGLKELVKIYQKLLKCPRCPMTFFNRVDLENHLGSHSYDNKVGVGFNSNFSEIHDVVLRKPGNNSLHKSVPIDVLSQELEVSKNNANLLLYESNGDRSDCDSLQSFKNIESEVIANKCSETIKTSNQAVICKELKLAPQSNQTKNFGKTRPLNCESEILSGTNNFSAQDINSKEKHDKRLEYSVLKDSQNTSCSNLENTTAAKYFMADYVDQFLKSEPNEGKFGKSIVSQVNCDNGSPSYPVECCDIFVTDSFSNRFPFLVENKASVGSDKYEVVEETITEDYCTLFKCSMCPMIFVGKQEIEGHAQSHSEEIKTNDNSTKRLENSGKISSSGGSNKKGYEYLVVKTVKGVFNICLKNVYQKYYKCIKCPMVFLTKLEVQNHKVVHEPEKMLNYNNCFQGGVSISSDEKKREAVEKVTINNDSQGCDLNSAVYCPVFQCFVCELMFLSKAEFESHFSIHKLENSSNDVKLTNVEIKDVDKVDITNKVSLKNDNQDSRLFCISCNKKFNERKKYSDHIRLHRIKNFKCNVCGKRFRAKSNLKKHMQVHSRPFSCAYCHKSFKSEYVLELHQALHSEDQPSKSIEGGNSLKQEISVTLHNFDHLTKGSSICEVCKDTFENSQILELHMKTHLKEISDGQILQCSTCNVSFSDKKEFQHHLQTHLDKEPYECRYCNKRFSEKLQFVFHQKLHSKQQTHMCDVCKKIFSSRYSLVNHMDTHSSNKQYLCYICGASLVHRSSYYSHMKKHTGVREHHCKICEKKFHHKGSFKRHMSMHFGKKPYQCELCKKSFKQSAHLKSHLFVHSGEKPHQCKTCNKSFSQKSSLKVHLLTHTGGPFKCPECSRKFTQKIALLNHMKNKVNANSYHCKVCSKAFTRKSCLVHHKRVHLLGTCVINFDGQDEVIETFIDVVDEHKEIIINQVDMCESGGEIVDVQAMNFDITETEEVIIDSLNSEAVSTLDSHESQLHIFSHPKTHVDEFIPQLPQGLDLSNLGHTFVFSTPEDQAVNHNSIVGEAVDLDLHPFDSDCNIAQEVHFNSDGNCVVALDACKSQALSFSSLDPHSFAFDMKSPQELNFLPESDPTYTTDQEEVIVSSSKEIERDL
ncbi:zinc finger protein 91-like [Palaemon carinicauda]|uniref:zinc finger protein 91-like n=1 Tax=Palaemon carinicauda TaxID=392227 RepID=UPI0035B6896A